MTLLAWNPYFDTGIEIVDTQHHHLVDQINAAAPRLALAKQLPLEELDHLFAGLRDYARLHFETEERLMQDAGIEQAHWNHHYQSHHKFIDQVNILYAAFSAGDGVTGDTLLTFLANWLVFHILGEDQAMAQQIKAIAAGESAAEAYRSSGGRLEPAQAALTRSIVDLYTLLTERNHHLEDINHELTRAQAALALSERHHRQVVEALSEGVVAQNRAGQILLANPAAEVILGLTHKQLLEHASLNEIWQATRPDGSFFTDDEHPATVALRTGQPQQGVTMSIRQPSGRQVWILVNAQPLFTQGSAEPDQVVVSFQDITQRLHTEAALREREEIFQAIVSQAMDAIVLIDAQTLKFVEFNEAAHQGLGYSRAEFARLRLPDIHVADPEYLHFEQQIHRHQELMGQQLQSHFQQRHEHRHRHKDGSLQNIRASMRFLQIRGRTYFAVIWSDITQQRQNERELASYRLHLEEQVRLRTAQLEQTNLELRLARDDAEAGNRTKNAFLSNISQALHSPLNHIHEQLRHLQGKAPDTEAKNQLDLIQASADQLGLLLTNMIDVSRLGSGTILLEPGDFSLAELMERLNTRFIAETRAKDVEWCMHRDPQIPSSIFGDARRLEQLLTHLLENALQFTETGTISLRCHRLYRGATKLWLRFEVEDTGCGISRKDQDNLFSDFHPGMVTHHPHAGMGLALCRRIATLMGGQMGIVSAQGTGSLFWLELILGDLALAPPSAAAGSS